MLLALCVSPVKCLPKQLDDFPDFSLSSMFSSHQHSRCEMTVDLPLGTYPSVPWASAFRETDE